MDVPIEQFTDLNVTVQTARFEGAFVVTVYGELDLYGADLLRTELDRVLDERPTQIAVDLLRVTFLDSTSLGVLVPILHDAGQTETTLGRMIMAAGSLAELAPLVLLSVFFSASSKNPGAELGLLAGFIGQLHNGFFNALFVTHAPSGVKLIENVIVGPLVAVLSFVCSVGNIPLAAVLWSGGISFAGVIAFIFADLIVLPIVAIYRKYYGGRFAARIVALMFVTMALAALAIDGIFSAAGLVPETRPARSGVFMPIGVDYKLVLNIVGAAIFVALITVTLRRGATDPMCGMTVDRAKALRLEEGGRTYYFCGPGCRDRFAVRARGLEPPRAARPSGT